MPASGIPDGARDSSFRCVFHTVVMSVSQVSGLSNSGLVNPKSQPNTS